MNKILFGAILLMAIFSSFSFGFTPTETNIVTPKSALIYQSAPGVWQLYVEVDKGITIPSNLLTLNTYIVCNSNDPNFDFNVLKSLQAQVLSAISGGNTITFYVDKDRATNATYYMIGVSVKKLTP